MNTYMFSRIRKAIVAGVGAGVAGALGAISTVLQDGKFDGVGDLSIVIGAFCVAFVPVAWATWRVPNDTTPTSTPFDPERDTKVS